MTQCPRCGEQSETDFSFKYSNYMKVKICSQCYFELKRDGVEKEETPLENTKFREVYNKILHGTTTQGALFCRKCGEGYWSPQNLQKKLLACVLCGGVVCRESKEAVLKHAKYLPYPFSMDSILDFHFTKVTVSVEGDTIKSYHKHEGFRYWKGE